MAAVSRAKYPYVEPVESVFDRILGVWRFRIDPDARKKSVSTPGHLFHLVVSGSYQMTVGGKSHTVRAGDAIYYYECEDVGVESGGEPVDFYSVGFTSRQFRPLPADVRLFPAADVEPVFAQLHDAWVSTDSPAYEFAVTAAFSQLLLELMAHLPQAQGSIDPKLVWPRLERLLRTRQQFRPSLDELCGLANCSRTTLVRSCRRETGMSPMVFVRRMRMNEARGLLAVSMLTPTQAAAHLGYPRLNEFSREFSSYFGKPPSRFRPSQ